MSFELIYENYNVEELDDVLENIDKEAYPERTKKILEEREKRSNSKLDSDEQQSQDQRLIGVTGAVYSPSQAALGAFVGGPIASLYFIKTNFEVLGCNKNRKKTITIGSIVIFSLLVILQFLPSNFPNLVIPLLTVVTTRALVEKLQFSKKDISMSQGLKYKSNMEVLFTSIICLALFLLAILIFITVLDSLWVAIAA